MKLRQFADTCCKNVIQECAFPNWQRFKMSIWLH